jgi:chloride channel protein, CIC family
MARLGRIFYDTLTGYLRGLSPISRRFWLLVPLTGVIAGLGAVGSVHLLHFIQGWAWGDPNDLVASARAAGWARRLFLPIAGGVLVVLVALLFRAPPRGHGTAQIIEAIWSRQGRVPLRWAIYEGVMTLLVVGLGASLGREGALVTFGAASGAWLGRRSGITGDQLKLLVACGATAGIAAAYNTPIGGALFGLEVFLGGLALELYGPLIFASVAATLVSRALLYDHPSYVIPHYKLDHAPELILYLVLGVVIGILSAGFVRAVEITARLTARVPPRLRRVLPVFALALVGAAGIVYPEVLGNGYDTVNEALRNGLPLSMLLLLPVLKLVLTTLCASSGAPGALFTPSLFIGGLAGGAFGVLARQLFPGVVVSPGGYVLVGMAATLAGSTHATLAAALLLFELTGSYDLILPILAACVVSTAVSRAIAAESIYTAPLRRRGVELPRITRPAWMQREGVRTLVREDAPRVSPSATLEEILLQLARLPADETLYVVDDRGRLHGAIPLDIVRDVVADQPSLELIVAADLAHRTGTISLDASLWEVTRRALAGGAARLPVLSPREGNRFVGSIAVSDVLAAAAQPGG